MAQVHAALLPPRMLERTFAKRSKLTRPDFGKNGLCALWRGRKHCCNPQEVVIGQYTIAPIATNQHIFLSGEQLMPQCWKHNLREACTIISRCCPATVRFPSFCVLEWPYVHASCIGPATARQTRAVSCLNKRQGLCCCQIAKGHVCCQRVPGWKKISDQLTIIL